MEIKQDFKNELFKRREMSFVVESEKNPSFAEMKKVLSEKSGKSEENIDVFGVKGHFGINTFLVKAYIYDTRQDLEKAIQKTRKQRKEEKKVDDERKKVEAEAKKKAQEEAMAAEAA